MIARLGTTLESDDDQASSAANRTLADGRTTRQRRLRTPVVLLRSAGLTALSFVVLIGLWWGLIAVLKLDPFTSKTPMDVWRYLFTAAGASSHRALLLGALGKTLSDAAIGYVAGTITACALAAVINRWRTAEQAVLPVAMVLRAVPLVAMTPVITLVAGRGLFATTLIASIVVFFPTVVNLLLGFRSVTREALDLMNAYGATENQIFWKVQVPSSLPAFFAAARIAIPGALIGVLIAEWLATGNGIGYLMVNAQTSFDYNQLWSAAVLLTAVSAGAYMIVETLERMTLARRAGG